MGHKSTSRSSASTKARKDQSLTIANLQGSFRELREKPDQFYPLLALIFLTLALLWSYWNTLVWVAGFWNDPLYSHGWLVPIFTLVLLWIRREPFVKPTLAASMCGLALLAGGLGLRMVATHYSFVTIDAFSLVPSLAGVFLLVGGWSLIRWAGPAILFLVFMFPLPTIDRKSVV